MRSVIAFFVDRSLLVNLITAAVCLSGIVLATGTNRALLPSGGQKRIHITAELPGASAVDMERFVTFRLEEALQGLDDVDKVTSTTSNGSVAIQIAPKPGADVAQLMESAQSRLGAVRHLLPPDLRPLRVEDREVDSSMFMALRVQNVDPTHSEHRRAVEALVDKLRRQPNVVGVESDLRERDLYIRFSPKALERAGLSVTLARERIVEFLGQMPVGSIRHRDQDIAVEVLKPLDDLSDLRELPLVVNRAGRGLTLGEVATIGYELKEEAHRNTIDGKPFVGVNIHQAKGSDTITASRSIREVIATAEKEFLPAPLKLTVEVDTSEVIEHELSTLQGNGIGGILLVLLILMLFLGWRTSAMTALGLPFCYCGLVLVLHLFGMNFNLISLVAMILVVGILVDDAIIVSEEFCQQLERSGDPRTAALDAVSRVGKPVVGMVATTVVAFLPLVFMQNEASWLLKPLPIVIIGALLLSLFESFFLLPNHLRHFLSSAKRPAERRWLVWLRERYRWLLGKVLTARYVMALVIVGLMGAAVALLMGPMRFEGNLSLQGRTTLAVELPEAAESLDDLAARLAPLESYLAALPREEVETVSMELGRTRLPSGQILSGWKYALVSLMPPGNFIEKEERRHALTAKLKKALPELEALGFKRIRFNEATPEETRDVISIYVSGGDRLDLQQLLGEIRQEVNDVEGVRDVFMDTSRFQRSLRLVIDDSALLAYGLTERAVQAQLREHFSRQELLRHRQRGEEVEVFLGFQEKLPPTAEALSRIQVMSPRGLPVPLSYIGKWEEAEVLRRIEHRDMLRNFQIDVQYDQTQIKADEVSKRLEARLQVLRERHPGYHISVEPDLKSSEAKAWAIRIGILCIALIYICLTLSLGSLVQPVVVLFAIPFGFVGVVLAFYLHGLDLGIMAMIGILGLAGVVVNDSLVMTSTINDARQSETGLLNLREAILDGAATRFRAVVLTSLTTLSGVFPLAYGIAGSAGWLQPMVLAVGWGLLCATVLTLFFIPCLLLMLDDARRVGAFLLGLFRRKPAESAQTPVIAFPRQPETTPAEAEGTKRSGG